MLIVAARVISASYCNGLLLAILSASRPNSVRSASLFDATVNTSSLAQISNLDDADSWLGYSCATIGGEITTE